MTTSGGSSSSTLASAVGALVGGVSGNNSNNSHYQLTAGTTATLGLSFILLRFVVSAAKAITNNGNDDEGFSDGGRARGAASGLLGKSEVLYQFIRSLLQRVIVQHGFLPRKLVGDDGSDDGDGSEEDNVPMIHKGSCHCQAVCFELIAPQKIECKESINGKIQYRHARIRAKSFRFVEGAHLVSMYYVNKDASRSSKRNDAEVGAHSFCSRCGVHFLHAPNSRSKAIDVNVDCLNQMELKIKAARKRVNLAAGISVADQWEHDQEANSHRYPATIAEGKSKIAPFDHSSPFAAYRHHPLMRYPNHQDWDRIDSATDDGTIDLVFPGSDKAVEPATPSTVYTTQESLLSSSNGVPPTLTLDTRHNDAESVVSLSSLRSGFPPLPPSSSSLRASAADSHSFGAIPSPANNNSAVISPSTTPLVRQHLNTYLRKHMSSSISSVSTSSSRISPTSVRNSLPPKGM